MGYSPWGRKELDMTERLPLFLLSSLAKDLFDISKNQVVYFVGIYTTLGFFL